MARDAFRLEFLLHQAWLPKLELEWAAIAVSQGVVEISGDYSDAADPCPACDSSIGFGSTFGDEGF